MVAQEGFIRALNYLESKGVDISEGFIWSPNVNTLRYYLEKGIDPNIKDEAGNTALSMVSELDEIKLLLDYGADPLTYDESVKMSVLDWWKTLHNRVVQKIKRDPGYANTFPGYERKLREGVRLLEEAVIEEIEPGHVVHSGRPYYEQARPVSLYHPDDIPVIDYEALAQRARPVPKKRKRRLFPTLRLPNAPDTPIAPRHKPIIRNTDATFDYDDNERGIRLAYGRSYGSDSLAELRSSYGSQWDYDWY